MEQFLLNPFALPDSFALFSQKDLKLSRKQRRDIRNKALKRQQKMDQLTQMVARAEKLQGPTPTLSIEQYPETVNNIIGSWLAKGVDKYHIELFCCLWMCNHPHMNARAPFGMFDRFMGYLKSHIARDINRYLGRRHQLWAERYKSIQILDQPSQINRMLYCMTNPQKANLVNSLDEWPGISSRDYLLIGTDPVFLSFDRTRWHRNKKPKNIGPYLYTVTLKHAVLPQLKELCPIERQRWFAELVATRERVFQDARNQSGKPVLGIDKLMEADPTQRPRNAKRTWQPLCHAQDRGLRKAYATAWRLLMDTYKICSNKYKKGDVRVIFPAGMFCPSRYPPAREPDDPRNASLPYLCTCGGA